MPQVTIYVPPDLHEQIRELDLNVSAACQGALRRKVRVAQRAANGDPRAGHAVGRIKRRADAERSGAA